MTGEAKRFHMAAGHSRAWLPLLSLLITFQLLQAEDNDGTAPPFPYITSDRLLVPVYGV